MNSHEELRQTRVHYCTLQENPFRGTVVMTYSSQRKNEVSQIPPPKPNSAGYIFNGLPLRCVRAHRGPHKPEITQGVVSPTRS